MKPLADCKLYTFVDTTYLHGRAPELVAQQLCDGGSDLIQLRAKNSSPDEIRRMAENILPVTRRADVGLVINDRLEIARELGAEFCHLGQEDFFDAGHKHVSEFKIKNWFVHTRVCAGATRARRWRGLHRHRPGVCDGHEADSETRDAGLCPLGGGECNRPVVRHRRN